MTRHHLIARGAGRRVRHCGTLLILAVMGTGLATLGGWPSTPCSSASISKARQVLAAFPPTMVWAWERPELLDFLDVSAIGVAFLARTLYLSGTDVIERPRLQPLSVPRGTKLMAVVRITSDRQRLPSLSQRQRDRVTAALVEVGGLAGVEALQIDFDATVSERSFYGDVLRRLRRHLPEAMPLSITALASWCIYDDWLAELPIDEAVPMAFRMGADEQHVRRYLAADDFRPLVCQHSIGLATDEPLPPLRGGRRLYLFHPYAWRPRAMARMLEEVGRWTEPAGNGR